MIFACCNKIFKCWLDVYWNNDKLRITLNSVLSYGPPNVKHPKQCWDRYYLKWNILSIIFMFRSYFYIYMYAFITAWILLDGLCMSMHYNVKENARRDGWGKSAYHWDTNQRIMYVSYNYYFACLKLRPGGYSAKYCILGLFYYFQCTLSQHFNFASQNIFILH